MKEADIAIDSTDVTRINLPISLRKKYDQNSHYLLKFTAKNPSHKEMLGPNGFTDEFYHIFWGRNDTDST